MNIEKSRLVTVKNALQYAALYAKTESEAAEFALMCVDVEGAIAKEKETEAMIAEQRRKGCVFYSCDNMPPCKDKCKYS